LVKAKATTQRLDEKLKTLSVPEGHLIIAQHFSAGKQIGKND
jgi:hypothetical protein